MAYRVQDIIIYKYAPALFRPVKMTPLNDLAQVYLVIPFYKGRYFTTLMAVGIRYHPAVIVQCQDNAI